MSVKKAKLILELVKFRDHEFLVLQEGETGFYLQLRFISPDDGVECHTRKWRLSSFMTKSELVQTALKAVLTSEEHQAREFFTYTGKPIFGPHFDVETLCGICERKEVRS